MPKKMQKRVLKVMGIWKATGNRSDSEKWIHGNKKELKRWLG